jgi:predicted HicB family RNase H-like nuclease
MITNKLRSKTVDQVLEVVEISKRRYFSGLSITSSINVGIKEVARSYQTTYQTIGDACRKRLGFNDIEEFKDALLEYFRGNPTKIISVLKDHTDHELHHKINDYFSRRSNIRQINAQENKDKNISRQNSEVFTFRLDSETSNILKMLVAYKGVSLSEWVSDAVRIKLDDLKELLEIFLENPHDNRHPAAKQDMEKRLILVNSNSSDYP